MAARPMVSIITPTYNHERFIAQCIESVLAQSYPYWEQIIIDDGSTDRTSEIVARYRDDRITYTRQENRGIWQLSRIYNDALMRSKGQYIAILEGDDFWPPHKLERQMKAFEESNADISWGRGPSQIAMEISPHTALMISLCSLEFPGMICSGICFFTTQSQHAQSSAKRAL